MTKITSSDEARFDIKFTRMGDDECWSWDACTTQEGYGHFSFNGRSMGAHVFAFMRSKGIIPEGFIVCHTCDNRRCVNPGHMFLGTKQINADDMVEKKRGVSPPRKITDSHADEMRMLYATGVLKIRQIAGMYDLGVGYAGQVINYKWHYEKL